MVENVARVPRVIAAVPSARRPEELQAEAQAAIQAHIDAAIHRVLCVAAA